MFRVTVAVSDFTFSSCRAQKMSRVVSAFLQAGAKIHEAVRLQVTGKSMQVSTGKAQEGGLSLSVLDLTLTARMIES